MNARQRRVVFAICVIVGLTLLVAAGLTFLVAPMAIDLRLPDDVVEDALVLPAIASLIVVFVAGRAGDRWGARHTIVAASLCFAVGSAVLAAATGQVAVQVGLALCGIGAVVIQVVALSLLQQTASEGKAHVSAFTTFGMVFPIAFLVFPIATGFALGLVNWRWIPIGWAIAGLVIAVMSLVLLDRDTPEPSHGEWWTPLLAGIALAAGSTALADVDNVEIEAQKIVIGAVIFVVAAIACAIAMRRMAHPSFSLRPLRVPLMRPLMIGVLLVSLVQLLTYVSIALEYLYDMTAFEAAVVIAPAQIAAIIGAKFISKAAIHAWGTAVAGRRLVLLTGVTTLPLIAMQANTPAGYLVAVSTLFSFAGMAALTVLNLDVMSRAPQGITGAVSALRTSASTVGSALGMAILGTILLSSVHIDEGAGAVAGEQAAQLAQALRIDGVLTFVIMLGGWAVLTRAFRRRDRSSPPPVTLFDQPAR